MVKKKNKKTRNCLSGKREEKKRGRTGWDRGIKNKERLI